MNQKLTLFTVDSYTFQAPFKTKGVMSNHAYYFCIILLLLIFIVPSVFADTDDESNIHVAGKVVPIGSDYLNSIQLLNNRFRVDSDVQEVTLVFFREYGSTPVVLVRPDGSKLFLDNDATDNSFEWFETDTYDMISLMDPMPGPWQAVGSILPESRVMVIAGISLQAEPIPNPVFSGETIKQTAFLKNAGSKVNFSAFRDVVTLTIEFISTNKPEYANFGIGARTVARFEDNGMSFDEYEGDGTFTGEFDLTITEGEWRPVLTLKTPLFSREKVNENILLLPNPITVNHEEKVNEQGDHQLLINVDKDHVKPDSVLVDGAVRHPNGEVVSFSLTQSSSEIKRLPIMHTDFGIYKVNMRVYAQTIEGRDLVLSVPEYSFAIKAPEIEIVAAIEDTQKNEQASLTIDYPKAETEQDNSFILWAIVINLCLLLIGGLVIFLLADRRNNPQRYLLLRMWQKIRKKKSAISETGA